MKISKNSLYSKQHAKIWIAFDWYRFAHLCACVVHLEIDQLLSYNYQNMMNYDAILEEIFYENLPKSRLDHNNLTLLHAAH